VCRNLYYIISCFFLSVLNRYSKSGKILENKRNIKINEMWIERIGIKNIKDQFDPINSFIEMLNRGSLCGFFVPQGKRKTLAWVW
jgi:hypothetical protein